MCQRRAHSFGQTQMLDRKRSNWRNLCTCGSPWRESSYVKTEKYVRGAYSSVCVYIWAANCRGFIQLSRKLSQKLECQESEGWGWWGRQCQARINYSSPPPKTSGWNSPRLANPEHILTCFGLGVNTCVSEHILDLPVQPSKYAWSVLVYDF